MIMEFWIRKKKDNKRENGKNKNGSPKGAIAGIKGSAYIALNRGDN